MFHWQPWVFVLWKAPPGTGATAKEVIDKSVQEIRTGIRMRCRLSNEKNSIYNSTHWEIPA